MQKTIVILFAALLSSCAAEPYVSPEPKEPEPECNAIGFCDEYADDEGIHLCNTDLQECVLTTCTDAFCRVYLFEGDCRPGEKPGGQCCNAERCCDFDDAACLSGEA